MDSFFHWWVSLFAIPGPGGKIDLQHAADTAGYWAQAVGTVLAVFAAIALAGYQQFQKRRDAKTESARIREALTLVAVGLDEMVGKLISGDLAAAHQRQDPNVVPQAKRLALEYHATLAAVALADLARADAVPQVHGLRKSARDVEQILAYVNLSAPLAALQISIDQLGQVRSATSTWRKHLES